MYPTGPMIQDVADALSNPQISADKVAKAQVLRMLNASARDVAGIWPWVTLKRTVTLSDSLYLVPGDYSRALYVENAAKDRYHYVGEKSKETYYRVIDLRHQYNWLFDTPVTVPLAIGNTLKVGEYATAVTSTADFPATTCAGEFIRIKDNPGVYQISAWASTSAITLTERYRGNAVSNGMFSIRPIGTKTIGFCDETGATTTPTGMTLTYIRATLPLYREEDLIELPGNCNAVRVLAVQKMLKIKNRLTEAIDMQGEFDKELQLMKSLDPLPDFGDPSALYNPGTNDSIRLRRYY